MMRAIWPGPDAHEPRLPLEPLAAALRRAGLFDSFDPTTRARWRRRGVPLSTADTICCRLLFVHPFDLYGPELFDRLEVEP